MTSRISTDQAAAVSSAESLITLELDPLSDTRWGEFVDGHADASIFHHPEWLALLNRQYGYRLSAWTVLDSGGKIIAGLPLALVESRLTGRRLVAVPFSDFCRPLGPPEGSEPRMLLEEFIAREQASAQIPLEIHGPVPGLGEAAIGGQFLRHVLDLSPGFDVVRRGFKANTKRGVEKARREGLTIERSTAANELEEFYRLHLRTRRRQGVPTQPKQFILSFSELFDRGLGFTMLVRHRGRAIAAAVFLTFNQTLIYKYGASDERFLRLRPNNLLLHDAISTGIDEGAQRFDLGRTDLTNPGLASFKRGWGASEELLAYTYLGRPAPAASRRGTRLLQVVIRNSPRWTGRAIGAALYRHVG